jgi:hypothetical protein
MLIELRTPTLRPEGKRPLPNRITFGNPAWFNLVQELIILACWSLDEVKTNVPEPVPQNQNTTSAAARASAIL